MGDIFGRGGFGASCSPLEKAGERTEWPLDFHRLAASGANAGGFPLGFSSKTLDSIQVVSRLMSAEAFPMMAGATRKESGL